MSDENGRNEIYYTSVPPDLHPGAVLGQGPAVSAAKEALTRLYGSVGEINKADATVQDKVGLFSTAMPILEEVIRGTGKALEAVKRQEAIHAAEIEAALAVPVKHQRTEGEIRAHFKASKSPFTDAVNALRSGDMLAAQALLNGPYYLAGLASHEQQVQLREIAASMAAPAAVQGMEDARRARAKLERALEYTTDYAVKRRAAWAPSSGALLKLAGINKAKE